MDRCSNLIHLAQELPLQLQALHEKKITKKQVILYIEKMEKLAADLSEDIQKKNKELKDLVEEMLKQEKVDSFVKVQEKALKLIQDCSEL